MTEEQSTRFMPEPAPHFTLPALSGGHRSLSDYRGRPVLLIFIQPRCAGSQALLPVIAGLLPDPRGRQPVPVVVTFGPQPENRRLVEEFRLRCAVLSANDPDVIMRYQVEGTPACRLIDARGHIAGTSGAGPAAVLAAAGLAPGPGWGSHTSRYEVVNDWLNRLVAERDAGGEGHEVAGDALHDGGKENTADLPLISVILTTRERPRFLKLALECYRRQTYPRRELIVLDDGSRYPADEGAVAAAGGRLIRMPDGTPLGDKLNRGIREAHGRLCHKWDDDDWYSPDFLNVMASAYREHVARTGRPAVVYQIRSLWFDLAEWRILDWSNPDPSGGTLIFAREDWDRWPFREDGSDLWFVVDQLAAGVPAIPVYAPSHYLYVRHDACAVEADHIWSQWDAQSTTLQHLREISVEAADPATLLPDWAIASYRDLRQKAG
jgi:peroxiredoxin